MKWFKHENTFNNPKIEVLTDTYGMEGYGVYFGLLELIASHIDTDNKSEWGFLPKEYTIKFLAKKLRIDEKHLENIIDHCVILNLFQKIDERIYCQKILERCDDYFTRLVKQPQKRPRRNYKVTPNKLRSNSEQTTVIEEEREQEEEQEIEQEEKKEIVKKKPYALDQITDVDLQEIATSYNIPLSFVASKLDDLRNWHNKDPRKNYYQNYKWALRDWVKRDAMKITKEAHGQSKIAYINDEDTGGVNYPVQDQTDQWGGSNNPKALEGQHFEGFGGGG